MRLPEDAARTLEKLESDGWESYAVGGCVRDSLLGIEPHDWDLCTAAPPEAMKKVFAGERVIETGLKHGTLTLLAPSGPLEITTFRTESGYSDCRHPDRVSFVRDIHADLARRDFTVNAMAYSPVRGLRDDFGGREDLGNGVLRCVGDPETRFREDALRMLRALSGRAHTVCTGVSVRRGAQEERFAVSTRVFFRPMTDDEIRAYIKTGEPMDKAGAYGVQSRGALFVERIDGDFFNVMGLPVEQLGLVLARFGVKLL